MKNKMSYEKCYKSGCPHCIHIYDFKHIRLVCKITLKEIIIKNCPIEND